MPTKTPILPELKFWCAVSLQAQKIDISTWSQDGKVLHFLMHLDMPMQKMFDVYALKRWIDPEMLSFRIDGKRIFDHSTARTLGMEEGDHIDVMMNFCGD